MPKSAIDKDELITMMVELINENGLWFDLLDKARIAGHSESDLESSVDNCTPL